MYCDPNGNSFRDIIDLIGIGLIFVGSVIATVFTSVGLILCGQINLVVVAIKDIILLSSGKVYYENGQIVNSSQIVLPTSLFAYSMYLKYFSPNKEDFKGTAMGIYWEWQLHNIAFYILDIFNRGSDAWIRAKDVDLGSIIYDDDHNWMSYVMFGTYFIINPIAAIYDLIKHN